MKPIFITLLILTSSGDIKTNKFEIFSSCNSWFDTNVAIKKNRRYNMFSKKHYYRFNNKNIVGYICSDK